MRIERIDNLNVADTGDGTAEADELIAVKFIGPAEAVDELSDGLFGDRIALVVGELIVLDDASVLIGSFGGSQVHDCLRIYRVYTIMSIIK